MFLIFYWSIYRQFVPNTDWKHDSFKMMIFVNVCYTWSMVELKKRFETWISRNDVNGVSLCHISYLITHMANLWSRTTPNVQIKYLMFDWSIHSLFVLNSAWKRDSLQMMIFVYVCSTWSIVELKTRFDMLITRNDVNVVSLFHLSYLITFMAYLCSQRTPNVQVKFLMLYWSIYRSFVPNTGWKRDSVQMMIFVCLLGMRRSWTKNLFLRREKEGMT
jgi:hypothetical protein